MKLEQQLFTPEFTSSQRTGALAGMRPQLVLAFGGRHVIGLPSTLAELRARYTGARFVLASTSGEITDTTVTDDHVAVTALALERTRLACAALTVANQFESRSAGRELATRLRRPDLVHVFVVSDGQRVNGTELARGFNEVLPPGVTVTGGLAGDGERFEQTLVGLDEVPVPGRIVAIAFYGQHLAVGFGSSGGWTPFGATHTVTASEGNILFQLDAGPAFDVYWSQLGPEAAEQPAAALSYPLCVTAPGSESAVVRSVLAVDRASQSLLFAGDVPTGSKVQFMQASMEDLIAGAARAAEMARLVAPADLVLCVSCVGRRIVLGARTAEEIVGVRQVLGAEPVIAGFYSYGELAPAGHDVGCQLHNQTMTITTLREM